MRYVVSQRVSYLVERRIVEDLLQILVGIRGEIFRVEDERTCRRRALALVAVKARIDRRA